MAKEHQFDHEISLTPYAAANMERLMLMKDDQGRSMCTVTEDVQPHASQLKFIQKDWTGGHGQLEYKDPAMYFEGQSIDTTQEGRSFLGPLITQVNAKTLRLLDSCQLWHAGSFVNETTDAQDSGANDVETLPATATGGDDISYFGDDATFDAVVVHLTTKGVGTWTIVYEYWKDAEWTSLTVTDDTTGFTAAIGIMAITFTKPGNWATTAINGVTAYWVRARLSVFSAFTTAPLLGQVWVRANTAGAMNSTPKTFAWFPVLSKLFCADDKVLYEYDGTNWIGRWATSDNTIKQIKVFAGYLYICAENSSGSSVDYWYTSTGDTFTLYATASKEASGMVASMDSTGTSPVAWRFKQPNIISFSDSPIDGGTAWSTDTYLGDTANNISNIFMHGDNFLIGKQDGLWQLDADAAMHPLMSFLRNQATSKNFAYIATYKDSTLLSIGDGLAEITSYNAVSTDIGPLANMGDIGKTGTIKALAVDKDWVYCGVDEGTNSHIYKGKERPDGKWAWCPWIYIGTNALVAAEVVGHSSTDRRLWFSYGTSTGYVVLTDSPTDDSLARFAASGWVRMSYTYGANPYFDKLWQSVILETIGCAAGITTQVEYRKDTDTAASTCTSASTANGLNKTNLSSALACNRIQFQIDLATNDSTKTPEVSYFEARGVEKPEVVRTYECVYYVGDTPGQRASTIRTFLRNCRASTGLIKFADLRWGESTGDTTYKWVVLQPGFPTEVEILREKGRAPELGLKCRWQEISYTVS